jgi:hypothetical protein
MKKMTDANKLFFNCETCQSQHHNQQPQHNKMSLSKLATEVTQEYAAAMEEAITSATKAETEANRLKRKYEPDESEVLRDKILHLQATYDHAFMRVQIFTGEKMELTLIPQTRKAQTDEPDWTFRPHLTGRRDNIECIEEFGIYRVYVGGGGEGYALLVTFNPKGVRIQQLDEPDPESDLEIEYLSRPIFQITTVPPS